MIRRIRRIIREHCSPLAPLPTGWRPRLRRIPELRAVLFDVYGTLFVSSCGDIGWAGALDRDAAAAGALAAAGVPLRGEPRDVVRRLEERVAALHAIARSRGLAFPEVEIRDVWSAVIADLGAEGLLSRGAESIDIDLLAAEYELRVNPVWPMPHVCDCLEVLAAKGLRLGLISNAQFYTEELFPALLGKTLAELGFDPSMLFFSFRLGAAKPDPRLYRAAARGVAERGLPVEHCLYAGNDMIKDVVPANLAGFRTALFAGDARSLRSAASTAEELAEPPDLILTSLLDLTKCIE